MKTVKQADYDYIDTLVRTLDASNELSAKISGRIDFDEHFSVIVEKYFSTISKCAEFITDHWIVKKLSAQTWIAMQHHLNSISHER